MRALDGGILLTRTIVSALIDLVHGVWLIRTKRGFLCGFVTLWIVFIGLV